LIRGNKWLYKIWRESSVRKKYFNIRGQRILMNRILSSDKIDAAFIEENDIINNSDVFNLLPLEEDTNIESSSIFNILKNCVHSFFRSQNINLNRKAFPKLNVGTLERFPIPITFFQIRIFFQTKWKFAVYPESNCLRKKLKMENYIKLHITLEII